MALPAVGVLGDVIQRIISHLFRLPFANLARGASLASEHSASLIPDGPSTRAQPTLPSSSTRVVDVLVPVALNQAYSYRVPRGMELKPGDVVCVPLGPREVVAVVWAENANPDPRLHNRLKDVGEKLDVPPLKEELRSLVDWVANYTLSARGMVLRMALRMGEHLGPERMRLGVRLVGEPPRRLTPARRRLIEVLSDGLLHGKSEAAQGSRRQRRRDRRAGR